jgi:pimeloyl-ACP methyl ester carboxylesterase
MADIPQTAAHERTINAGGVPIAVTEFATPRPDAPPVVLLHGIGSRGQSWWPVIDPLAARFRLFALDLRGHGVSGKPERGYLLEDYADDLAAVLDALALERPRIVGASLGALIALIWASANPARAAALVLEDPSLRTRPEVLGAFDGWQVLAAATPEQAADWYRQEYPHWSEADCRRRAETITGTAPGVFAELRAAAEAALADGTTDRLAILSAIESPALLVYGNPELGGMVGAEDAARFARLMPRAWTAHIACAGHNLHRDASDAFLAVVVPFLEGEGWEGRFTPAGTDRATDRRFRPAAPRSARGRGGGRG